MHNLTNYITFVKKSVLLLKKNRFFLIFKIDYKQKFINFSSAFKHFRKITFFAERGVNEILGMLSQYHDIFMFFLALLMYKVCVLRVETYISLIKKINKENKGH